MMNPPDDLLNPQNSLYNPDAPRNDQILHGEFEITLPPGAGRKRCRAIRVVMRTKIKLDLGPGRMGEEDTIFERKVEVLGGEGEGLWLDEGSQR